METNIVINGEEISKCKINRDTENSGRWIISSWFTLDKYQHQGYGKAVLKEALEKMMAEYGSPTTIEYIWNGVNQYVFDWLNKFDAVCKESLAVAKNECNDTWDAHIYILNSSKVLEYAGLMPQLTLENFDL